jgi:imidazolonepropionase-like amidohydrolase
LKEYKMRTQMAICIIIFLIAINVNASDPIPAPAQKQPIALVNAVIHPVKNPVIDSGIILFDKGLILDLGTNVIIPAEALIIDLEGKHVYPGLIESYSRLGLTEIGAVRSTNDYTEMGQINPNVRAEIAVNPESEHFPVTRSNGIATAITLPRGGIISGKSALIKLDGWTWEEMTLMAPVSMIMNWPQMQVRTGWWRKPEEEQKKDIKKNKELLEKTFKDARAYLAARESAKQKGVPFHKKDLRLDALIPVLKGELPLWITANNLLEIEAAVSWAGQQKIKMVLVGGADAIYATELLKEKDIPVIITSILRLPVSRDSDIDEPFTLPKKLHRAGIRFCISGTGASNVRNLPYHAAKAASYGLPKEEALKAITLYAAEIIGVADRIGSLEKGKEATLMVTDGDPLEIMTKVEKLYIQGRDIDLMNKHKRLYMKYQKRYQQIGANIK